MRWLQLNISNMDFILSLSQLVIVFPYFIITSQKSQSPHTSLYGKILIEDIKIPFTQTYKKAWFYLDKLFYWKQTIVHVNCLPPLWLSIIFWK